MPLKNSSNEVLNQLAELINALSDEEFRMELSVLSGNTIGKHVRHIVEMYQCLISAYPLNTVNYDLRERNTQIENDRSYALSCIESISNSLLILADKHLDLIVGLSKSDSHFETVKTTFNRELVYNIEHCIHHMAIIKIAVEVSFNAIAISSDFGVAPSTLRYNEKCAQ
jgi:uncharacterized damage-inducible protein DinB